MMPEEVGPGLEEASQEAAAGSHEEGDPCPADVAPRGVLPPSFSNPAVKSLLAVISEALAGGNEVRLPGLGVLMVRTSPARMGRNPRTGESIAIPARNRVRFSLAGELRSRLNP